MFPTRKKSENIFEIYKNISLFNIYISKYIKHDLYLLLIYVHKGIIRALDR